MVHFAITLGTLAIIKAYTPLEIGSLTATGALVGSYLPDIDIRHSTAGKVIPAWLFTKHRGPTHSLLALIVVTTAAAAFNIYLGIGLGFGYLLHLGADLLTSMHLPYWNWYPGKESHK